MSFLRSCDPKSHGVSRGDHGHARLFVRAHEHRAAFLADVDLAREIERHRHLVPGLRDVRRDLRHVLGDEVVVLHGETGSSIPTIRPTSRAHSPPALTTCSVWIDSPFSRRTSQVASGRCDRPDDRRALMDLGAELLSALDVRAGDPGRVDVALRPGSYSAPTKYCGSMSGKSSAASFGVMSSSSMPR
jgi:hypothetical protein